MTSVEIVWGHLKEAARDYASRDSQPSFEQAYALVKRLIREARVSPEPPPYVVEMYARELMEMTQAAQASVSR